MYVSKEAYDVLIEFELIFTYLQQQLSGFLSSISS